jgi:hypothetical protein
MSREQIKSKGTQNTKVGENYPYKENALCLTGTLHKQHKNFHCCHTSEMSKIPLLCFSFLSRNVYISKIVKDT